MTDDEERQEAVRARVTGAVQAVGYRAAVRERALSLGLAGWVRNEDDGSVSVHAEGGAAAVELLAAFLRAGPSSARVQQVEVSVTEPEGHEQFAVRGVAAGRFLVREHQASSHHFDLRLEVGGVMRSWALPRGPTMDPATRRLAVQVEDHPVEAPSEGRSGAGGWIVWDNGLYEQGGRVPWPAALDRGHAVFVLRGQKLRGGFALQRTRGGVRPQWLLIKRRDALALPGSDVVAAEPASVLSGRTLEDLLADA